MAAQEDFSSLVCHIFTQVPTAVSVQAAALVADLAAAVSEAAEAASVAAAQAEVFKII